MKVGNFITKALDWVKAHQMASYVSLAVIVVAVIGTILAVTFSKADAKGGESPSPSETTSIQPSPSSSPTASPSPSLSPSPTASVPALELPENPLTGVTLASEDKAGKRPVAVMMNNIKKALPMSGISQADIIYETLVEGGITRMLAVFYDLEGVGNIGTVRSARTAYLELALGHDALFVHAGGSDNAYAEMSTWKMDSIDFLRTEYTSACWRDEYRAKNVGSEHSLYTSGSGLQKLFGKVERKTTSDYDLGWKFADYELPKEAAMANDAIFQFTSSKSTFFTYEESKKLYYVSQQGGEFMDEAQDKQVAVTNVIALRTDFETMDDVGRQKIDLVGSGKGYFCMKGKYVGINWSKESRDKPLVFTTNDGEEIELGIGKTYICIIPSNRQPIFK